MNKIRLLCGREIRLEYLRYRKREVEIYLENIGVPINELDDEVIPLVWFFNKIGMATEFSCIGHDIDENIFIIFKKEIEESQVIKLLDVLLQSNSYFGHFNKWIRNDGKEETLSNWMYEYKKVWNKFDNRMNLSNQLVYWLVKIWNNYNFESYTKNGRRLRLK